MRKCWNSTSNNPLQMFKVLRYLLFLFLPLYATAQDFTQFDWEKLRIDSVVPTYHEVVPLETDYRLFDYTVSVRYPEWAALTKSETERLLAIPGSTELIADTLVICSHVGISRGEGLLDISFVPIVHHGNRFYKLLSGKVEIAPFMKPAKARKLMAKSPSATNRWASQSVLAQGRWVKISVESDGIYHLTHAAISEMGFGNPANIRVYGYGGHLQKEVIDADTDFDDLEEVSLWPVADGYLFYANGLDTFRGGRHIPNHYARAAYYFVTEAGSPVGAFPSTGSSATPADTISTFDAYVSYHPQGYAWYHGGRQLFENYDYASGNSHNYTLTLPYRNAGAQGRLAVSFSAAEASVTQATIRFNNNALGTFSLSALPDYSSATVVEKNYTVNAPAASNIINITSTKGHHARLNFLTLNYTGAMVLDGGVQQIRFTQTLDNTQAFEISYATGQQPQLWRLPERGKPATAITGTATTVNGAPCYRAVVDGDGTAHSYVAFNVNAYETFPQPTIVGEIGNQNLHAVEAMDMVIITPASGIFDAEAERLAAVHREVDGLRVGVFRADMIYNEFSSGTPDATAYRRFLKMLYDRATTDSDRPRYLLLFGDCAWDNRMLTSAWSKLDPNNFLLCFESENSTSDTQCYVMEEYFGLLDDGEGRTLTYDKTDVGVGRFPVRSLSEAKALVDKTIRHIRGENIGAWRNVVCVMGDDGDNNQHLRMADNVANTIQNSHPELEVRKVIWDAFPVVTSASGNRYPAIGRLIQQQMEEGALMMNYTGHAATYCLSHEMVLRIEDFAGYKSPRAPLWVTAACDVMPFDSQINNIGETAILNPNGAAVAFYGTARTVFAQSNEPLNVAFSKALFAADASGRPHRVGDAVRISKMNSPSSENKLHYALLGDPALTFGNPSNRVVLDAINGTPVVDLPEDFMLHAGGKARFSGHIERNNGETIHDFKGILTARLYDSESTVACRNNTKSDTVFTYRAYDKILYNGQDSVRNGRFDLVCPVPIDIRYSNKEGRLLLYANTIDCRYEANGYSHDFELGGTEPGITDGKGPVIFAYLNDDSFTDGQTVGATPYFVANISDENGISAAGNGLGHDLELIIDGNPITTYTLNDYFSGEFGDYTHGHVAFSIPRLEAGEHQLVFRAWDLLNNPNSTTLNFVVDPELPLNILKIYAANNPARSQTQFLVSYDRPGSVCEFTVEVFDFTGRLLWSHAETGSNDTGFYAIPWNLTTGSGFPLGSGIYLYRARVKCDNSEEATASQKLIVNRRQ